MPATVKFPIDLTEKSIQSVIDDLEEIKECIAVNLPKIVNYTVDGCEFYAQDTLKVAKYDYDVFQHSMSAASDVSVVALHGPGFGEVIMVGEQAAFVEFGAGIAFNAGTEDPIPRSNVPGIVPIGQYGLGHGSEPYWSIMYIYGGGQPSEAAEKMQKDDSFAPLAIGTPAMYPLSKALIKMKEETDEFADLKDFMWDSLINGPEAYHLH